MFGNNQRRKEALRLNDLIKDVLLIIHGEFESHQIDLQPELDGAMPSVLGDRVQIQQVLLNLFTNAVEAMTSVNERPRLLSIKSEVNDQDGVLITIKDSGSGIDSPNVDRIFDAFFTTKLHGMGMGLSICRSIVENHGGRLWVEPGNPYGAMFRITLPVVAGPLSTSEAG
jgi:signal transduction histidine kinase